MAEELAPIAGTMLAHYRIESRLGAGGMGEVYLARDTKLDRTVALKVLPSTFASDRERMGRFLQEAKAASSLSHPNVAHIYEIGEHAGLWFIAMECVEGQTIEQLTDSRRLDPAEISQVGAQVADALAAAHARGIVHRDIKPGNIMLTSRGHVKVLDFGIAKVKSDPAGMAGDERTTLPRTATGVVVGTVHYMSPEQALGKEVDPRSDLFSLGVVLYHMATGRPPFVGESPTESIDKILHEEPDPISRYNSSVPQELERIILKCLRKPADERYQSAADLASDLAFLRKSGTGERTLPASATSEYYLPRDLARGLLFATQLLYIGMYLAALRWSDQMMSGFEFLLDRSTDWMTYYFILTAMLGMAVRLFIGSLVVFDHARTGIQFRRVFPAILLLDATWAAAPLCLAQAYGPVLALACVPPLAFLPFSQRTLVRSAYDLYHPRRTSTGRRPAVEA